MEKNTYMRWRHAIGVFLVIVFIVAVFAAIVAMAWLMALPGQS